MSSGNWHDLGPIETLGKDAIRQVEIGGRLIALTYADGRFGAISGACLHAGGPLGEGTLVDGYIVCPWHHWMFHRETGEGLPGYPVAVARYELKEHDGHLLIDLSAPNRYTSAGASAAPARS